VKQGTLYLVGTPIGNMGDLSNRAVEVLSSVSLIACEDTRRTGVLCRRYGITTPLTSFHEYNERVKAPALIRQIRAGDSVALVSDAGMPAICDPGARFVEQAGEAQIPVAAIPGPSALITALALSGFRGERFRFEGFPPRKPKAIEDWLRRIGQEDVPVICYESPYRLVRTLQAIQRMLGEIPVVVARELTKLHEELTRGSTTEVLARYTERPPKGEVTLLLLPQGQKRQEG
jgi:16S rRNA (cytidine1402-2'-O)-methyltransferase